MISLSVNVFFFGALARGDGGNFGRCSRRPDNGVERDRGQRDREYPKRCEDRLMALIAATLPQSARVRKA